MMHTKPCSCKVYIVASSLVHCMISNTLQSKRFCAKEDFERLLCKDARKGLHCQRCPHATAARGTHEPAEQQICMTQIEVSSYILNECHTRLLPPPCSQLH